MKPYLVHQVSILRYKSFDRRLVYQVVSFSEGYQMAFPDSGFQWLRDHVGVKIECFASPLNCWNQRFCSVARDTDRFFGSLGNFFLFDRPTGIDSMSE
jgi:hypothetical protein